MAEMEYPIFFDKEICYDANEELREGFIKGYQSAQEEIRQKAIDYAKFCIHCEREGLPLLEYDGWLNLDDI